MENNKEILYYGRIITDINSLVSYKTFIVVR